MKNRYLHCQTIAIARLPDLAWLTHWAGNNFPSLLFSTNKKICPFHFRKTEHFLRKVKRIVKHQQSLPRSSFCRLFYLYPNYLILLETTYLVLYCLVMLLSYLMLCCYLILSHVGDNLSILVHYHGWYLTGWPMQLPRLFLGVMIKVFFQEISLCSTHLICIHIYVCLHYQR